MYCLFLHSQHHHGKHTSVLSQNAVIQIQAGRIVSPDNNIETLGRNHPEIFSLNYQSCNNKITAEEL